MKFLSWRTNRVFSVEMLSTFTGICFVIFAILPTIYSDRVVSRPTHSLHSQHDLSVIVNVQPDTENSNADNSTIFELVTLNKLQRYGEDVMGVRRFQEPFWLSLPYLASLLDSAQWNLKTAQRKFKKSMDRRTKNAKLLNEIPSESMYDYFTFEMNGYDKEGCPIVIAPLGEWRTYRSYVEKIRSIEEATRNLEIYLATVIHEVIQKIQKNHYCSRVTFIADMERYSTLHNSGLKFFIDAIKDFEKSYPGILKIVFIINSSPAFLKAAKAFKYTVPWDLRRKSFVFTDENVWKEALLQTINPSQLAEKYGGTNFFLE